MFAVADEVLDPCRSVGHEATVPALLAGGPRNRPGDPDAALTDRTAPASLLVAGGATTGRRA